LNPATIVPNKRKENLHEKKRAEEDKMNKGITRKREARRWD
jgi:hypothetical protein